MTAQRDVIGGKRGQIEPQSGGKLMQCLLETRQVKHQVVQLGNGLQGVIIETSKQRNACETP